MSRRRFIADTWTSTSATLTGDQAAHLARVLRATPGQIYDVVANGFLHRAEITAVSPDAVHFTLHEELQADAALPLHLLIAIFKFDHLEWGLEKATELGVARITPILARRTEKHLAQAAHKRVERWRRIALEASKQSRRTSIPDIADPTPLQPALLAADHTPNRILLSEIEQSTPLVDALLSSLPHPTSPIPPPTTPEPPRNTPEPPPSRVPHPERAPAREGWGQHHHPCPSPSPSPSQQNTLEPPPPRVPHPERAPAREGWGQHHQPSPNLNITHALAIGPEGGWTPEELQLFLDHHWQPVTLGPRILRAETAAIAAIAIASAHLR